MNLSRMPIIHQPLYITHRFHSALLSRFSRIGWHNLIDGTIQTDGGDYRATVTIGMANSGRKCIGATTIEISED